MKRSIKFDDAAMNLVMDVRLSVTDEWERVEPRDVRMARNTGRIAIKASEESTLEAELEEGPCL